jgi:hypothetical protein
MLFEPTIPKAPIKRLLFCVVVTDGARILTLLAFCPPLEFSIGLAVFTPM